MAGPPEALAPLDGIRVVDVSGYVSGGFAGMILADLGADVVKVEPSPKGDLYRYLGRRFRGTAVGAVAINRGKRSVALDLKSAEGLDALADLLSTADVLLDNWRPGVADQFGLTAEEERQRFPRLIHVSITGYGPTGPLAGDPAFDAVIQAMSGIASVNRIDGRPMLLPTYLADKVSSLTAALTIVALLRERDVTGQGCRCDVPMLDAMAYFNTPDVMEPIMVADPEWDEELPPASATVQTIVQTEDGWIVLSPATKEQIQKVCAALGHAEWWDELQTLRGYSAVGPALVAKAETVMRHAPTEHWLELLRTCDVPHAPILTPVEHLKHPQVVSNGIYVEHVDPNVGRVRSARFPATVRSATRERRQRPTTPAPDVGEHDELLESVRRAQR